MRSLLIVTLIILSACIDSDETRRDRFFLQGNQALSINDFDKAIHYFDNAILLDPDFSLAYNNRGVAKLNDDRAAEAVLDYNQAININPKYYEAIGNRAYAYEQVNRYSSSLRDWQFLVQSFPDSAFLHLSKAIVLTKSRAYDEAEVAFLKVLDLEPDHDEAMVNMGILLHYKGDDLQALNWLNQALDINENNAHAFNTQNQIYLDQGNLEMAMASIDQALKLEPDNPYFLNNRGFTKLLSDSLDAGLKDINKSILLDATNMWAFRNKGIYHLKKGDYASAIRYLQQAQDSEQFVEKVFGYLGEAQWLKGEKEQACASWQLGFETADDLAQSKFRENCQ